MTPENYEHRIAALGFENGTAWADFVGIDRATHYRHLQRDDGPPKYLQHIVTMLELLPDLNPNTPVRLCPFTDFAGNPIKDGDVIKHPSGQTGVVRRVDPISEPETDLWRVDYGSPPLSRLCLQIGDKGRAVVVESGV